jgi:hypothetical protein
MVFHCPPQDALKGQTYVIPLTNIGAHSSVQMDNHTIATNSHKHQKCSLTGRQPAAKLTRGNNIDPPDSQNETLHEMLEENTQNILYFKTVRNYIAP